MYVIKPVAVVTAYQRPAIKRCTRGNRNRKQEISEASAYAHRSRERTRRGAYIKAGVTAARAWTNRESVWSSAFFFFSLFHSLFLPLPPRGHTDSPLSGHALCSHGLTARVGSRSRALRLQRGMHARIAYSTMRPDQPRSAALTPSRPSPIKIDPMNRTIFRPEISRFGIPFIF